MRAIFALVGIVIVGAIASRVGSLIGGPILAIFFGVVGGAFGLYYGRKLFDEHLGD